MEQSARTKKGRRRRAKNPLNKKCILGDRETQFPSSHLLNFDFSSQYKRNSMRNFTLVLFSIYLLFEILFSFEKKRKQS